MDMTDLFAGTRAAHIIEELDVIYSDIDTSQLAWKSVVPFHCTEGCGSCCVDFEPDILESEALYLAAWLLMHNPQVAFAILENRYIFPRPETQKGCLFFDADNPYHCSVYGGRTLICRLFGYTGDRGKDGRPRWKPCKFLPLVSAGVNCEDRRKQYSEAELIEQFGIIPPLMSDLAAQAVSLMPELVGDRKLLRVALKPALEKIVFFKQMCRPGSDPDSPEPDSPQPSPESPFPRAS